MMDKESYSFVLAALTAVTLFLAATQASANGHDRIEYRWKFSQPEGVAAFDVGDVDGDGKEDVVFTTLNNTLYYLDHKGKIMLNVSLGNRDEIGRAYAIVVSDVDGDSINELVIGFGQHRVVSKVEWDEYYNLNNLSVGRYTRILYRTTRVKGGIQVRELNTSLVWEYPTDHSVRDIAVEDIDNDDVMNVVAGLGSYSTDEYWELQAGGGSSKENWNLVEYTVYNGSMLVLDADGVKLWDFNLTSNKSGIGVQAIGVLRYNKTNRKFIIGGSENGTLFVINESREIHGIAHTGNSIYTTTATKFGDTATEGIMMGTSEGMIYRLTPTGYVVWRYKMRHAPRAMYAVDLDEDDEKEIFIGNVGRHLYVLDETASVEWRIMLDEPIYHLKIVDMDGDDIPEIVYASSANLTVYELSERYVKKEKADVYYRKAFDQFEFGDYTLAAIYVQKAWKIYHDIKEPSGYPKTELLIKRINEELLTQKALQADLEYGRGLQYYGKNKFDEARTYLKRAQIMYIDLNDTEGASQCIELMITIENEIILNKKLEADSIYTKAMNYYAFKNYTAAERHVREAHKIYSEINNTEGVNISLALFNRIADGYFSLAEKHYIGLQYKDAEQEAIQAVRLYKIVNDTGGMSKTSKLLIQIRNPPEYKQSRFDMEKLNRILPPALVVLVAALLYTLMKKKKAAEADKTEKYTPPSLEEELDSLI